MKWYVDEQTFYGEGLHTHDQDTKLENQTFGPECNSTGLFCINPRASSAWGEGY